MKLFINFVGLSIFLLIATSAFGSQGDLVSLTHLADEPSTNIIQARKSFCPDLAGLTTAYGFKRYKVTFKSLGLNGQEVVTTGLLIVPDAGLSAPMLVYQHGTLIGRSELPSSHPPLAEGDAVGYCYASLGYVSLLADYLGFGDSTGVHPYLHADSEAWVARDMMRASKTALLQLGVGLNSKLFIAGYSQGGHAAMSLLRYLEADPEHEFTVTAAAPMAGPYHLSETVVEVFSNPSAHSAIEGAYIVVGLNPIYGIYQSVANVFEPAYVSVVATLFDGSHDSQYAQSVLSVTPSVLFLPSFVSSMFNDANSPLRKALTANDVYQWTPKTPLHLYHSQGDHEVPFFNSQEAYDYMKATGANVQLVNLGQTVDHPQGFVLAIGQAGLWFESLR